MPEYAQHHWLHELYLHAPVAIGIYLWPAHRIEFANPRMCELWGRNLEQVHYKPLFEALPEVAGQGFEEILAGVLSSGEPFSGEELPATLERSGKLELCYFNILYQPLREEQGKIIGVTQVAIEVTSLVVARKQAEEREKLLQAALEAGKMGSWYVDLLQGTVSRSLEYDRVFGYEQQLEEWSVDRFLEHVLPNDRSIASAQFEAGLASGILDYEVQVQWPDQSIHWVHVKGETAYNRQGNPISMTGIIQDVTLRKQIAEHEIKLLQEQAARQVAEEQHGKLVALFMQAPAAICILSGPELVYELVNPGYQHLFPGRKLVGKPVLEALPELVGTPIAGILQDVYQTGKSFEGKEVALKLAREEEGPLEELYFNFVYQARRDAQDLINGILVFAYEVTEQIVSRRKVEEREKALHALNKELAMANQELATTTEELHTSNEELLANAEQLATTNEQLAKVNVDLDNFVYAASHDLKSPVNSLQGLLQVLERRIKAKLEAKEFHILELCQESVSRLSKTIQDLSQIAKVQHSQQEEKETVYFNDILSDVTADLKEIIQTSSASLHTSLRADSVFFSRQNVRSILYNLISNAIKYRSPDRVAQVHIATHQQEGKTVLTVTDNGLGLSAAQLEKLFQMFKRFHDHVEGSGIGLYMIKRMLENNGGSIQVESRLGEGTTFRVYF